jgi:hypothetical protein
MPIFNDGQMGLMPGESYGIPQQAGWQDRIGGLLSGDNALFNVGLGILANNNTKNTSQVLGRGIQQGMQQTQTAKQLAQQNKRYDAQLKREQRDDKALDAQEAAHADFDLKFPQYKGLSRLDPKVAIKLANPEMADPTEYGLVPQKGINPKTNQAEMFIQDKGGNTKWLGIVPPPDYQVFGATDYTSPYAIDKRNPGSVQNLPMPGNIPAQTPMLGQDYKPQATTDPRAPWNNLQSPKQIDEAKQRTYTDAQKQLDEVNAIVKQGGDTQAELQRFLELNQGQGTGGLIDRTILPSLDSDKREMEAIQARLAPKVREPGSGTTSDRDIALYLQGLPGVDKPGGVNKNIVEQYTKSYQKAQEKQSFYNAYLQEYGHLNGAAELFEKDYQANHPKSTNTTKATAKASPLPAKPSKLTLKKGVIYETPKGQLRWNGSEFED